MLQKILCAMLNDEKHIKEFIKLESNGPELLKFLAKFEVTTPEDVGAVLKFETDSKPFYQRLKAEVDAHFEKFTGTGGQGGLRWPGSPLTLESLTPKESQKATATPVRAAGYFFGNDPKALTLFIGETGFSATACSESDPDIGSSTADFTVEIADAGTYDVRLVKTVGNATQENEIPSGFTVI
jgi:hypothetical protein